MKTQAIALDTSATDTELVRRARARDEGAVREITNRFNRRLYRIARSILHIDHEAEDVVQETYVRAFTGLDAFRGESSLGTWLTRIAINDALGRVRRRRPTVEWSTEGERALQSHVLPFPSAARHDDPETTVAKNEIRLLMQRSIDNLPDAFRTAFVARMVEGLSVEETAELLGIRPETVKTRVHRARARLMADLDQQLRPALTDAFPFDGERCQRMTERVLTRLRMDHHADVLKGS